jgi:hypothetical protein
MGFAHFCFAKSRFFCSSAFFCFAKKATWRGFAQAVRKQKMGYALRLGFASAVQCSAVEFPV